MVGKWANHRAQGYGGWADLRNGRRVKSSEGCATFAARSIDDMGRYLAEVILLVWYVAYRSLTTKFRNKINVWSPSTSCQSGHMEISDHSASPLCSRRQILGRILSAWRVVLRQGRCHNKALRKLAAVVTFRCYKRSRKSSQNLNQCGSSKRGRQHKASHPASLPSSFDWTQDLEIVVIMNGQGCSLEGKNPGI